MDLKNGSAVHAIAGERSAYRPVMVPNGESGNTEHLLGYYQSLGLSRFYIADLDALTGSGVQVDLMTCLIESRRDAEFYLDIGWSSASSESCDVAVLRWRSRTPNSMIVLATESMQSPDDIDIAIQRFGSENLAVSFDFRGGDFVSKHGSEKDWVAAFRIAELQQAVFLDVSTVGTSQFSSTNTLCDRMIESLDVDAGRIRWVTGGAVRRVDEVAKLSQLGCDGILVASALLERSRS